MRKDPNESYEDWAHRVQRYEHGYALQRIAMGDAPELVIDEMGKRMMQKLLHPIIVALKESCVSTYNAEESRKDYEKNYINRYGPKADHIDYD